MDRLSVDMVIEDKIPVRDFFRRWVGLIRDRIKLTDKEAELAGEILRTRAQMASRLGRVRGLLGGKVRLYLADSLDISPANLTFLIGKLRKKGFLDGDDVVKQYVPVIREGKNSFDLLVRFVFATDANA